MQITAFYYYPDRNYHFANMRDERTAKCAFSRPEPPLLAASGELRKLLQFWFYCGFSRAQTVPFNQGEKDAISIDISNNGTKQQ